MGPFFPRFLTFYPFADKNSTVISYIIIERGFFVGIYKKKGAMSFGGIIERKKLLRV